MISPMARDAKRKSESESITFRVERNVLDKLRAEAERKMESVLIYSEIKSSKNMYTGILLQQKLE